MNDLLLLMVFMIFRLRNYFGKYANTIDKVDLDTMNATMKSTETASSGFISASLMKIHIFDGLLSRQMAVQVYASSETFKKTLMNEIRFAI